MNGFSSARTSRTMTGWKPFRRSSRGSEFRAALRERKCEQAISGGHRHHLFAVHGIRDRIRTHGTPEIDLPEFPATLGIERKEVSFHVFPCAAGPTTARAEYKLTGRRKNARPRLGVQLILPRLLTRFRIERTNRTETGIFLKIYGRYASGIAQTWNVLGRSFLVQAFVLPCTQIKQSCFGTVGRRIPVCSALHPGPDVHAFFCRFGTRKNDRPAGWPKFLGPCLLGKRLTQQKLAGSAIEHVKEAAPVSPVGELPRPPLPLRVDQDRHLHRIPIV